MKPILTRYQHIDPAIREVPAHLARKLRRADEFIKNAVTACDVLLAGELPDIAPTDIGLFVGTGFGPMQTNFEVLDLILEEGRSSPFLFSHSVFNAAAGYIAEIYGIKGCAQTLTDFAHPFLLALREACSAIITGRLQRCLVLQVETYSPLLEDSRQRFTPGCSPWPIGGVSWLVESAEGEESVGNGYLVENLEIDVQPTAPESYLRRNEEITLNELSPSSKDNADDLNDFACSKSAPYVPSPLMGEGQDGGETGHLSKPSFRSTILATKDPLALAREVTNYLEKNQPPKLHCRSNADFGTAQLLLQKI